jgi:Coenzyme PQQ synthesis protein D (PqqD)/Ion channel inhibitory toxin
LPDGLIVYDRDRYQAHSLNRAAAFIWQQCDGRTRVSEIAARLPQVELPVDEALVWLALARLQKAHLLEARPVLPAGGVTRRAAIRKLGLVGGLVALLPVVDSLTPPAALAAVSPPHTAPLAAAPATANKPPVATPPKPPPTPPPPPVVQCAQIGQECGSTSDCCAGLICDPLYMFCRSG